MFIYVSESIELGWRTPCIIVANIQRSAGPLRSRCWSMPLFSSLRSLRLMKHGKLDGNVHLIVKFCLFFTYFIYFWDNSSFINKYCYRYSTLPYEGLIVCCLVVLNFILVVSDNKLRHEEIPHRVKILLDQLNGMYLNKDCRF